VKVSFIGGTGPEGKGLAYRLGLAGYDVIIGSRDAERAAEIARQVSEHAGKTVRGEENAVAASGAEIVVITVPFDAQAATLPPLRDAVAGKIVVSAAVPLSFEGGRPSMPPVPEGSAAEQAQALLPNARVAAAFQNLGAAKLWRNNDPLDQDIIVCSDDADAKQEVMALAAGINGARAVNGGLLAASRYVEGITVLLIGINRQYKATTGIRIAGLP
jgi:NADPH-dependent F420 reductase